MEICNLCCGWVTDHEKASPREVRDDYPAMMREVLMRKFYMSEKAADEFVESACGGNWRKLWETDVEKDAGADFYADMLLGDIHYCSDRWSWDRVLRIQWLYMRIVKRVREEGR